MDASGPTSTAYYLESERIMMGNLSCQIGGQYVANSNEKEVKISECTSLSI
jgi:hypothetical protein